MLVGTAVAMAILPALPALFLALVLATSQVPDAGWIALALAVAVWALLARRVLAQCVTLTPDTLVIQNILGTQRIPLAAVTGVGFRGGRLTVTAGYGVVPGQQITIGIGNLGTARWSGLRGDSDALADAIAAAAGLAPLPPRREIVSRNWAWAIFLAAAACVAPGVYYGPVSAICSSSQGHTRPFALAIVGSLLYSFGIATIGVAIRLVRDHWRKRAR
jgi:hypothetical protein